MSITVYSKPYCVQCNSTKRFLDAAGVDYTDIDMSADDAALALVKDLGYQAAPVVVVSFDDDSIEDAHWYGFRPDLLGEAVKAA